MSEYSEYHTTIAILCGMLTQGYTLQILYLLLALLLKCIPPIVIISMASWVMYVLLHHHDITASITARAMIVGWLCLLVAIGLVDNGLIGD